jgi:hypothetical protein
MPSCPHCGSPSSLKYPEHTGRGGDPPCVGDEYDETQRALRMERRSAVLWFGFGLIGAVLVAIAFATWWRG